MTNFGFSMYSLTDPITSHRRWPGSAGSRGCCAILVRHRVIPKNEQANLLIVDPLYRFKFLAYNKHSLFDKERRKGLHTFPKSWRVYTISRYTQLRRTCYIWHWHWQWWGEVSHSDGIKILHDLVHSKGCIGMHLGWGVLVVCMEEDIDVGRTIGPFSPFPRPRASSVEYIYIYILYMTT